MTEQFVTRIVCISVFLFVERLKYALYCISNIWLSESVLPRFMLVFRTCNNIMVRIKVATNIFKLKTMTIQNLREYNGIIPVVNPEFCCTNFWYYLSPLVVRKERLDVLWFFDTKNLLKFITVPLANDLLHSGISKTIVSIKNSWFGLAYFSERYSQ